MAEQVTIEALRRVLEMAEGLEARGRTAEARNQYSLIIFQVEAIRKELRRKFGLRAALVFGLASLVVPGGGLATAAVWSGLGYLAGWRGTDLVTAAGYQQLYDQALEGRLRLARAEVG